MEHKWYWIMILAGIGFAIIGMGLSVFAMGYSIFMSVF